MPDSSECKGAPWLSEYVKADKQFSIKSEYPAKRQCTATSKDITKSHHARDAGFEPIVHAGLHRKALLGVPNPPAKRATVQHDIVVEQHYNVLWRTRTNKKHKTWDGDGVLKVSGGNAYLRDVSGRDMGKTSCTVPLLPGSMISIGSKEIEVDSIVPIEAVIHPCKDFKQGYINIHKPCPSASISGLLSSLNARDSGTRTQIGSGCMDKRAKRILDLNIAQDGRSTSPFKTLLFTDKVVPRATSAGPTARHPPHAPDALVMKRPSAAMVPKGRQIVDVVVDPVLAKHLREHQREGVKFLYECVMGLREFDGQGAILADEMGLGKTLQTIALIWTLLKQNYVAGMGPIVKKALIVCPVSLVENWRKEFSKWLGRDRIGVWVFDETKKRITDFTKGKAFNVMIVGYEKLRNVHEELKKGNGIDIVIADEGHRLKTAKNKSAMAIKSLETPRRVILSGTPIQNDLSEFFMMVDFVNPGLLGKFKSFSKEFEAPILRSRQPKAEIADTETGQMKADELASYTSEFILRRDASVLSSYLPSKTEYVLICRPTKSQAEVYRRVLSCPAFQSAMGSTECALQLITILRKLCNSPYLLKPKPDFDAQGPVNPLMNILSASLPQKLLNNQASTKLRALDQLLYYLRSKRPMEKIVLVSNWTSTLELFQTLLSSQSYPFVRLDGSTPATKRQDIVDIFNRAPASECFAFLLSAKSGGLGLNLIGASRLVLFDVDWNPATDLQVMARIHRDGQKRPCFIYRFLMAGGLDEKIWQRQVTKLGLAYNILNQKAGASNFSRDELKDLFRLDEGDLCQTHKLIGCDCKGRGSLGTTVTSMETIGCCDEQEAAQANLNDLPDLSDLYPSDRVDTLVCKPGRSSPDPDDKEDKSTADALMAYSHLDTANLSAQDNADIESQVDDDVLKRVLKDEANQIFFAFSKCSM